MNLNKISFYSGNLIKNAVGYDYCFRLEKNDNITYIEAVLVKKNKLEIEKFFQTNLLKVIKTVKEIYSESEYNESNKTVKEIYSESEYNESNLVLFYRTGRANVAYIPNHGITQKYNWNLIADKL